MRPEIIVMLTHNDVTVPNALEVFRESADLPVTYWGFKDAGVTAAQARELVDAFKAAGKIAVLEVVTFQEDELREAAKLAVDAGFDYFTGSGYSAEVAQLMRENGIKYFPFVGDVSGSPIALTGTQEQIVASALQSRGDGVDGVDLVAYRFADGDPLALAEAVVEAVGAENVILAGSVNSVERIRAVQEIGPFAYTMGGALFEGLFSAGGDFRENLQTLIEIDGAATGARK